MSKYIFKKKGETKIAQPFSMPYEYKTRFSLLGTVGSGKSTIVAAIVLTAQTLSNQKPNFYCQVLENTTTILSDASNLRRGRFPIKTQAYQPFPPEAGLLMLWKRSLGRIKKVQIPICDVAGEDIQSMIKRVGTSLDEQSFMANQQLIQYVKDSDGFIIAVPASRALMFEGETQLEKEPADVDVDPDVNVARILQNVKTHKDRSRGKQIKGIAVIITKWDLIAPYASNLGIDLYDPSRQGMARFVETYFPATNMAIKNLGLEMGNIEFFPSYFQVLRNDDGSVKKWREGGDRIEVLGDQRIPRYSEGSYVKLFEWLKPFAQ